MSESIQEPRNAAPHESNTDMPTPEIGEQRAEYRLARLGPMITSVLRPLASLKLTVVLFALSIFLVFAGTLVQVDLGIWVVMRDYFRTLIVWIDLQIFFPRDIEVPGRFPFPGGWLLGGLLMVNLMAAHLVRFKFSWKRSGIILTHAGLMVLLLSEFITGLYAVEGSMTIHEGESVNYLEHHHEMELAVREQGSDLITVVSEARLRRGGVIKHESLPFHIAMHQYMPNSTALPPSEAPNAPNPATAGDGRFVAVVEEPIVTGVDPDQRINAPSAYVTFQDKHTGESLGTYLVSLWLSVNDMPQRVVVDDRTYEVDLRFKRTYKPYTMYLHEFRHDRYIGTDIPKNFSSNIRLLDPSRDVDRNVLIFMNNPLRYHGETFFQSSYKPGDEATILQVVRNPGWLMPYISCVMVGLGLLIHFGLSLASFTRRTSGTGRRQGGRDDEEQAALQDRTGTTDRSRRPLTMIPWIVIALGIVFLAFAGLRTQADSATGHDASAVAPAISKASLDGFSKLPVVDGGRVKPLDTLARVNLMILNERQTFVDESGERREAIEWLLDVISGSDRAHDHRVFRIVNHQVLDALGLEPRLVPENQKYRYSIAELAPKQDVIFEQARRADAIDPPQREAFDSHMLKLGHQYHRYIELLQWQIPHAVPPDIGQQEWRTLAMAAQRFDATGQMPAPAGYLMNMLSAWAEGDAARFDEHLSAYNLWLAAQKPDVVSKSHFEVFFNQFAPFYRANVLYVTVFILSMLAWLIWTVPFRKAAFGLATVAFLVHTAALIARMWLEGRPPVTNLYASAVFVGWGCVGLGLLLEKIHRNGIGTIVAAVTGFLSLLIAHHLGQGKDTLEMLQAVLDTNFWLATHVTTITLGYTGVFVAGFMGILYVLRGVFTRTLDPEASRTLGRMIYGVLCFALFLSFVGTVLGGIWADQSWGRFWGWDPKENGALIIVMWVALILHARWGGMVQQRGIAVMAIFGNIAVSWSWFGVNELGAGLHSYGFTDGTAFWLVVFAASQVTLIGLGSLPLRMWRSNPYRRV